MKAAIALALCLAFTGCATVTHIVTGEIRAPISAAAVRLYSAAPDSAVEIAQLRAQAEDGQSGVDRAVKALKEEAAKLGANGLVVSGMNKALAGTYALNPTLSVPISNSVVEARAIYVP